MAKVYRSVEFKVNLGNYEHVIVRGGVELDTEEEDGTVEEVFAKAQDYLESAVASDLHEAERNTVYGADSDDEEEKSFVSNWRK